MTIIEGGELPATPLRTPAGDRIDLRAYVGTPFVLYFYPKDDTSGCTLEAQDFSRLYAEFRGIGSQVLGVSRDTPVKHRKFIDKYDLTVPLASDEEDPEHEGAIHAFGVWVEKKLYGKTYQGIDRSTFLFDARGVLVRCWRKVRVPGHAAEVLEAVRALGRSAD